MSQAEQLLLEGDFPKALLDFPYDDMSYWMGLPAQGVTGVLRPLADSTRLLPGADLLIHKTDSEGALLSFSPEQVREVRVAIVGAGLSGIGMARQLLLSGIQDFVVFERAATIGGSWRDNDYPGCTCDIPSNLYSFSFALNPDWRSAYASRREIVAYLRDCADRWGVSEHVLPNAELLSAKWDGSRQRWLIDTAAGPFRARALVVATGPFAEPSIPALAGLGEFDGAAFHSARWDGTVDLTAQRVAVIGTGASAVQIVPEVAAKAAAVQVYQRTPPWVMPKKNRPTPRVVRALRRRVPALQRAARALQYWTREIPAAPIARRPQLLASAQRQALKHLHAQVPHPGLRAKLTPDYGIFCKRVLVSSDYYPALNRPHVELVTEPIDRLTARGVVTADGTARPVDVIVFATGFHVTDPPVAERLYGRDGGSLAAAWREHGRSAYLGTSVRGFPNLFLCTGPHAGTGHTSLLVMIEAQLGYIADGLRTMASRELGVVEVRAEAQREFTAEMDRAMARSVWLTGGCSSYYLDSHGRNTTLWPGSTWSFRRRTRVFDLASYDVRMTS